MKTKFTAFLTIVILLCLFAPISVFAGTINYAYDNNGRLTAADYGAGKSIAYTYDNNGNLLTRKVAVSAPQYVSSDGTCGGNSPCHLSIQDAINGSETGAIIGIADSLPGKRLHMIQARLVYAGSATEFQVQDHSNTTDVAVPFSLNSQGYFGMATPSKKRVLITSP